MRLLEEPLPPKAVTATTAPLATDLTLPTVPPTPDENVTVPVTEGARKAERAQVFVVEGTGGVPLIGKVCRYDRRRTGHIKGGTL